MYFNRKCGRFIVFLWQRRLVAICLLIAIVFAVILRDELTYHIYVRTVNIDRYRHAVTIWSSDYHAR
jgi:hypothetical protein